MTKKDVECQIHTWMIKKAKAMIYKGRKDRRKRKKKKKKERTRQEKKRKITSLGHVRRDLLLCSMFVS